MPNHHGYSRADDGSVVMSETDQATLDGLLLQRVVAKRARDFVLADQLRERLREAGVLLDDAESTYRIAARQAPRAATPQAHHSYTRADDGSVVVSSADQATLDRLLLERVRAKRERDFVRADELHRQLLEAGVVLDDAARTYRLRSQPAVAARGPGASVPTEHGYTRAEDDGGESWRSLPPDRQAAIERLLLERVTAKRTRQFQLADALRAQLGEEGAVVDDQARVYRIVTRRSAPADAPTAPGRPAAAGGMGGEIAEPEWTRDPLDDSGVVLAAADQAMLVSRLGDRRAAQRAREFAAADAIRDELRAVASAGGCLLFVDDKAKTFRFAPVPMAAAAEMRNPPAESAARARGALPTEHGYAWRTDDHTRRELSQGEQEDIDRLLLERVIAKRTRDFDLADEIRSRLQAAGCYVDDKARVYSVRAARPAGPPALRRDPDDETGTDLTPEQHELLERQLAARWRAQRGRQYELADQIRVELRQELNVVLNVRERTWRLLPPRRPGPTGGPDGCGGEAAGTEAHQDGGAGVAPVSTPEGTRGLHSPESFRDSAHQTPRAETLLAKRGRGGLGATGGTEWRGEAEVQPAERGVGSEEPGVTKPGGVVGDADEDDRRAAPRRRLSADGGSDVRGGVAEPDQGDDDDIVSQILYGDV